MNKQKLYYIIAFLVMACWGTTFISTKLLLRSFTPLQIMFMRYVIGYICLSLFYRKPFPFMGWKTEGLIIAAALGGSVIYFAAENTALLHTQASNVSLLLAAAPIATSLLAHLTTKDEPLRRRNIYGFLFAFLGVFLVVGNGHFVLKLSPIGDLLAIAAAISWSAYTLILRRLQTGIDPGKLTRRMFFYALIFMTGMLFMENSPLNLHALTSFDVIGNLLFLGVLASAVCYVSWCKVVQNLGAVRANNFIYLSPLITMTASVLVLKERVTLLMLAGAVLITVGVMIADGTLLQHRSHTATGE